MLQINRYAIFYVMQNDTRLRNLTEDYTRLERKLRLGGGAEKIAKIHANGKLTARERIDLLFDADAYQHGNRFARCV